MTPESTEHWFRKRLLVDLRYCGSDGSDGSDGSGDSDGSENVSTPRIFCFLTLPMHPTLGRVCIIHAMARQSCSGINLELSSEAFG